MLEVSSLLGYLVVIVMYLVGVAFFTLLERSVLGYIQVRRGPNSVGFMGLLQPFSDGLSLLSKEALTPLSSNSVIYFVSPIFGLFMAMVFLVMSSGMMVTVMSLKYGILVFMCISSVGVFSLILGGWSSNSSFSVLGGYRTVAQSISYEVGMSFLLFGIMVFVYSYSVNDLLWGFDFGKFILIIPLLGIWMMIGAAETNRSPFDLSEGESELVSGFNVEYGGGLFALIFIAEYMNIIMFSVLSAMLFFSSSGVILAVGFMVMFLWIRGSFPRSRYDSLMEMAWTSLLPVSLNYFAYFVGGVAVLWGGLNCKKLKNH